eukprot:522629-Heterocapsa_arctica.AAC.1
MDRHLPFLRRGGFPTVFGTLIVSMMSPPGDGNFKSSCLLLPGRRSRWLSNTTYSAGSVSSYPMVIQQATSYYG